MILLGPGDWLLCHQYWWRSFRIHRNLQRGQRLELDNLCHVQSMSIYWRIIIIHSILQPSSPVKHEWYHSYTQSTKHDINRQRYSGAMCIINVMQWVCYNAKIAKCLFNKFWNGFVLNCLISLFCSPLSTLIVRYAQNVCSMHLL